MRLIDTRPHGEVPDIALSPPSGIEESEVEGLSIAGRLHAQVGGVPAMNAGGAEEAHGLGVVADGAAGIRVGLDEEAEGRAARQGLEAERARAGEEVDHSRAPQSRRPGGVFEDVEDRLPRAIAGRPGGQAGRR